MAARRSRERRLSPRTRSRQTKRRREPGSPFCLVEQGYSVCGARDERAHAGQQQQLVDQLGHNVLPKERLRQNHNWEQELWFRDVRRGYFEALPRLPPAEAIWRAAARCIARRLSCSGGRRAGAQRRSRAEEACLSPASQPKRSANRRIGFRFVAEP